ncbi:MAG TPA: AMP-binding protein [Stellaceae bacterium]|nr:AMP-binding protein [Stellaceae bacterium]
MSGDPRGASPETYPLIRHQRRDAIFAFRGTRPITVEEYLADVAALAERLPAHRNVLNLCADRYRFAVGLGAALCRRQVSLMPPNDRPGLLGDLAADFPDLYCLADAPPPISTIPSLLYLEALPGGGAAALPALPADQPAVLLFTSGSTGRPKPSPKSWGTLVRSALSAGDRLGIAALPGATIVGTVPHQHSYGLESTVLLGLQHGLALQAERPLYPGDVRACLEAARRPRLLVTTPIHIRALMAEPDTLPQADLVISATAPLAQALAVEAEDRFRGPLLEIYGCSEAGQLATRRTAERQEWQGLDGVALRQDNDGTWAGGSIVEAPTLLQDFIELARDGRFLLHGRMADLVNIAGKRTSLAYLDHHLNAIPGVQDGVFVLPEGDDDHVRRLIAVVVAPDLQPETILAALRQRIDAAFLPRPLIFVPSLPRNALGKLPRDALLQLLSQRGPG